MIKNIFVVLHVITAAGWFGIGLLLASISRKVAESGGAAVREVGSKAVGMMTLFIVLTFVFGLIAFLFGGGFAVYGPVYHTSLLLILILVLIQFFVIRRGWMSLSAGGETNTAARKRIAIGTGVGHLIWLVVLVLMFWRYFAL